MNKLIDRAHAGQVLCGYLTHYRNNPDVIILALPRGGVPVAYEIAMALAVRLDVLIVRKLGAPFHEELALGAIASGNVMFLNHALMEHYQIERSSLNLIIDKEQKELARREHMYRGSRPWLSLKDKIVILVDDGMATGATMRVAIDAVKLQSPASVVVAIPVAAYDTYQEITPLVDNMICPLKPKAFYSVGLWYESFQEISDANVIDLLEKARVHQS